MDAKHTPRLGDLTVGAFTDALAAAQPAPGGGAAAALAGALAAALTAMVAGLTLGRVRYAIYQDEMRVLRERATALQGKLLMLMDVDAAAYTAVMAGYALPSAPPTQEAIRDAAIQAALHDAIATPLTVAEMCLDILHLAAEAASHGNRHAAGDAAVAALLAHAGLVGSVRNARINLEHVRDAELRAQATDRIATLLQAAAAALAATLAPSEPVT